MHTAIKFCIGHRFADDTNLLHVSKSNKKLNKFVNFYLKNLSDISLSVSKTELIIFKPRMKKVYFDLKLKLSVKRICPTEFVNYLGIKTDERLTWNEYINVVAIKLS